MSGPCVSSRLPLELRNTDYPAVALVYCTFDPALVRLVSPVLINPLASGTVHDMYDAIRFALKASSSPILYLSIPRCATLATPYRPRFRHSRRLAGGRVNAVNP